MEAIGPVAELGADNTVWSRFVYATRSYVPDYMVRDGVTYRFVTDELGSVRRVINTATGAIVQSIDYDPYGVVLADSQRAFQPFGYTGGITGPDTGLVWLGDRDYDPVLGRWVSKDPVGFAGQDTNLYAYVAGDPVNYLDPPGLLRISLQQVSDFAAGFAESYDFGLSRNIRIALGSDGAVDYCSGIYALGLGTGTAASMAVPGPKGAGLAKLGKSQRAKKRLAKQLGGVPKSGTPVAEGGSAKTGRWWEYVDGTGNRRIVVEHPDGTVHVGTPKPQNSHLEGGPPKYYDDGSFGHVGE